MRKPLWEPSAERKKQANITRFIELVNKKHGLKIKSYSELHKWSVESIQDFWAAVWEFVDIKASQKYTKVVEDLSVFPGTKWFPGAKLNFAENLLRYKDDRLAFVFNGEGQKSKKLTYAELNDLVARLAKSLRDLGIKPGDRVVGYMPNMIETAVGMLAATAIGATWSSCATDIGPSAALDRLGQVEPKVLITVNGYFYKGKDFNTLANAAEIAKGLPSLKKVVIVSYTQDKPDISSVPNSVHFQDFLAKDNYLPIKFEQLPFDHPVFIMFSSGTTGKPKCMVQGAGGILINHQKELIIHSDLKREDKIFYITTCSWMMWNWLLSSLAGGATILLYDGNPMHPDPGAMWKLVQDEKVTIFGLSASYVNFLRSQNLEPGKKYDLSALKEISQTGSPLSAEGFAWVYEAVKKDLHFNSIAGGTDINGCFAIGSPIQPVYAGELQSAGLGMKVNSYNEKGQQVHDQEMELVCEAPAPPMPLYFWNDPKMEKYMDAYFRFYKDKRVWRHGDYVFIHSDTGGITFCGRSDAVLKPSGVRIGTAEIYNTVEALTEIADSLAIGQDFQGDQRVLLFVKLAPGAKLDDALMKKINKTLRDNASPRHVPSRIIEVPDIPYTLNMKKVESSITNIVNGRPVTNRDALSNPQCLDFYEKILPDLQKK
ncbi:MAG: acetoacetate--CoA ligase [bacterium]|nr:acetoacetate--CoA ligase [bacterium]